MNKVSYKLAPTEDQGSNYQKIKIPSYAFLSDNESERCQSPVFSTSSGKILRKNQPLKRKQIKQVLTRKKKNETQEMGKLLVSPNSSTLKNKINELIDFTTPRSLYSKEGFQQSANQKTLKAQTHIIKKINVCSNTSLKELQIDNIRNSQTSIQKEKCCEHHRQLKTLKDLIKCLEKKNELLIEQSKEMKEKIKEGQNFKKNCILKTEFQIEILKREDKIKQQKDINLCLQQIIEGLNVKIDLLLRQQKIVPKIQDQPDQWVKLNGNSTYDEPILDNVSSLQITKINDKLLWLEQLNQKIQAQNMELKDKINQIRKEQKYLELQASLTKHYREELIKQKSLRQINQNKVKVLNNKIKRMMLVEKKKVLKKEESLEEFDDSLQFSIQLD